LQLSQFGYFFERIHEKFSQLLRAGSPVRLDCPGQDRGWPGWPIQSQAIFWAVSATFAFGRPGQWRYQDAIKNLLGLRKDFSKII
jgi:hypothetical protein